MPEATDRPARRIVVRGVNWLGDAVMTTPALLRLREAFPQADISLVTPEKLADLWLHHPAVDAVHLIRKEEGLWSIGRQLREGHFDLGLVLPNSPRSALELWLARVPHRVGYAASWRRCWLTRALPPRATAVRMHKRSAAEVRRLIHAPGGQAHHGAARAGIPPAAHHVQHYLHLVAAVGANPEPIAPQLSVSPVEVERVLRRFGIAPEGTPAPFLLGLNAGAEYGPAKRWMPERFVATAVEIQRRSRSRWLLLGSQDEVELVSHMAGEITRQGAPAAAVVNLAGQTTLRELCAVLRSCRVLLTNDTGPMHVAAALGTPVVVPFGSTAPELTGPGLPGAGHHRLLRAPVPCAPCFRRECPIDFRCMQGIGVEAVVEAVLSLL
jgi:heptosyltransferase-2